MTTRIFVRHGPAIPTELLHALEEDRLVFFCGAGISMGTGLPGFAGLVKDVLEKRSYHVDVQGRPLDPAMRDAFCREQFDKVLEIVEQHKEDPEGWMMRRAVIKCLSTPPADDAQLELHQAILTLARRRDCAGYRLVTTNFDNRFELAGLEPSRIEQAPRLSPPSRRDLVNVVHLHGRIDEARPEGIDLVLTSADFGKAYLHHGWAARFVVELFREFTVLIIGYGLNDPVMRYLVDALAATRDQFRKAYALASYRAAKAGDQDRQHALWSAKNVEPILYAEDHPEHPRHALLRETMTAWAAEREARLTGRLTVAVRATANPFVAGQNEASDPDGVNAVAWALSDLNGGVARQFADAKPVPDPSWWTPVLAATVRDPRDPEKTCRLTDLKKVAEALAAWGCHCLATKEIVAWATEHQGSIFRELLSRLPWALSRDETEHVVPEPYRRFWEIMLHLSNQRLDPRADWRHELPHEDGRLTSRGREIDDLEETGRLWRGYLFSPRISPGLLDDLKPMLLKAPVHRDQMDDQFDQLCHLITAITCIEAPDSFSRNEKQEVIRAMGPEGLGHGVWLLERRLANTEDAAELWRSRIGPWVAQCWPADRPYHDVLLLGRVDRMLLETRSAFPEAFVTLRDKSLIGAHETSPQVLWLLANPKGRRADDEQAFDYVRTFLRPVVEWLDAVLKGSILSPHPKDELKSILQSAKDADSQVIDLPAYQRLEILTA